LLLACSAVAAPVPKGIKAKPSSDGVWRLVLVSVDGMKLPDANGRWVFNGIRLTIDGSTAYDLTTPDPDRPHLRMFGPHPAVVEAGGDRLLFCYAPHLTELTECKPGQGVHYFEFERITPESGR
jgi:hypothetical protein